MGSADSANRNDDGEEIQYQFKVDNDLWYDWKMTVPRDKSLRERIIELIEEDAERGGV